MYIDQIPLRPHHGMCLAYFIGYGYSDEFSLRMSRLLDILKHDTPVKLTVGTDIVCGPCPNNQNNLCVQAAMVEAYDRAVLAACGLEEKLILPFGQFTTFVQERILSPGLRESICGGCQWNAICAQQKSRWIYEKE